MDKSSNQLISVYWPVMSNFWKTRRRNCWYFCSSVSFGESKERFLFFFLILSILLFNFLRKSSLLGKGFWL